MLTNYDDKGDDDYTSEESPMVVMHDDSDDNFKND